METLTWWSAHLKIWQPDSSGGQTQYPFPDWNMPNVTIQRCPFLFLTCPAHRRNYYEAQTPSSGLSSWVLREVRDNEAWTPRGSVLGFGRFKCFWCIYSSWECSRALPVPGCHTSGGTEEHCDPAPTFRGLLRGTTEENTECHCYIVPMVSSDMITWQTAVQLWPSTLACWKKPLITSTVWSPVSLYTSYVWC